MVKAKNVRKKKHIFTSQLKLRQLA